MKILKNKKKRRLISYLVAFTLMLGSINDISAFAAGVETLPFGRYDIGDFTFTNTNLSPTKTVSGTRLGLGISFKKASIDAGLGNVKLTVQIRDANTGEVLATENEEANENSNKMLTIKPVDLGYSGRKIKIWYDASSTGVSNGKYRSITCNWVKSIVD